MDVDVNISRNHEGWGMPPTQKTPIPDLRIETFSVGLGGSHAGSESPLAAPAMEKEQGPRDRYLIRSVKANGMGFRWALGGNPLRPEVRVPSHREPAPRLRGTHTHRTTCTRIVDSTGVCAYRHAHLSAQRLGDFGLDVVESL